jgi:hypothetical protein
LTVHVEVGGTDALADGDIDVLREVTRAECRIR